jgi:hypothetical protein
VDAAMNWSIYKSTPSEAIRIFFHTLQISFSALDASMRWLMSKDEVQ